MKTLGGKKLLFFLGYLFPVIVIATTIGFALPITEDFSRSLTLGESWKNGSWLLGHMGDDMVVDAGTDVHAAADGKVLYVKKWPLCDIYEDVDGKKTLVESDHGWGGVVIIEHRLSSPESFIVRDSYITSEGINEHPQVVYTQYGHLGNILVEEGQQIDVNQKIAEVGNMCKWRSHLHFEIKTEQGYLDDLRNTAGAGFGYSGTDGYAPGRYSSTEFILLNQNVHIEDTQTHVAIESPQPNNQSSPSPLTSSSFFDRIKFFSRHFSQTLIRLQTQDKK